MHKKCGLGVVSTYLVWHLIIFLFFIFSILRYDPRRLELCTDAETNIRLISLLNFLNKFHLDR